MRQDGLNSLKHRRAGVFQNQKRALEQLFVGEPDRQVIRIAQLGALVLADIRFGQLRQADAQVDIGARIVGVPSDAAFFEPMAGKYAAAEIESAVEGGMRGIFWRRESFAPSSPDLRPS